MTLLGVSLTGIMDHHLLGDYTSPNLPDLLERMKAEVVAVNVKLAGSTLHFLDTTPLADQLERAMHALRQADIGEPGAAADGHDARTACQGALLVDELHERLTARFVDRLLTNGS